VSPDGSAPPPLVTLLGRPGCHLCDEAREALIALRQEGVRFELRELNIEDDERLLAAHLERIPVIELDGEEISQLGFDPAALRSRIGSLTA
jgi:glutaredoxin